jgi:hypothetical protein
MSTSSLPPVLCFKMRQVQRFQDKKRQFSSNKLGGFKKNLINYGWLGETTNFGIENAINQCKV